MGAMMKKSRSPCSAGGGGVAAVLRLFLFLFLSAAGAGAAPAAPPLNDEILSLMVFKSDVIDPSHALDSWNEDDSSPCQWTGIVCEPSNNRVISLTLRSLSLSGHIARSLSKLQYLRNLSLSDNHLSGPVSDVLASLSPLPFLSFLDLSSNSLSGTLPAFDFSASFPSLRSLDLSGNHISGTISVATGGGCNSVVSISLAYNALQGPIPASFFSSCPNLQSLNLSSNLLDGTISGGSSLSLLDLSDNSFSGSLPTFSSSSLLHLHLRHNRLSGSISGQLDSCLLLQSLDLSANLFSGAFPASLQRMASLVSLDLSDNSFSGGIPAWIPSMASLQLLNLSRNGFQGRIPSGLCTTASPSTTSTTTQQLQVVDFSRNSLSGDDGLHSFSGCYQLKVLDLSFNSVSGSLSESLLPPALSHVRLSGNRLSGRIPDDIYDKCASWEFVDLSLNRLSGDLPERLLSTCIQTAYLNLSGNYFTGRIPPPSETSSLVALDLSHNQFTGSIPPAVANARELEILSLGVNKLNGAIPREIGKCTALRDLNVSHNDLGGCIPAEIGNMSHLQSLDLSHNALSGSIPPELGDLQQLSHLNLSYNLLEGAIPDDGGLVRFDESAFYGNAHLCGSNVNVTCGTVMPKPIVLNPNTSSGGDGEGEGDGGVAGGLLLRRRRQKMLSPSAILAISAGAAIAAGVMVVFVLNSYVRRREQEAAATPLSSSAARRRASFSSAGGGGGVGKLVMFSESPDPRSEEWVSSAHALLNKDCELGRGGMGTVYKAVLADGRTVAIKKLMVPAMAKSQYEFETEIQFLGEIKHRNLLCLQGYYWTPHLQLLIYDYIAGGSLYSRLHEVAAPPLKWAARFRIALGTARALAHLHRDCHPQVLHGNVKSSNVLLSDGDCPKLADYGLSKFLPTSPAPPPASGGGDALGYTAPELVCRSFADDRSDVYSYGVLLLELVSGRRPVEHSDDRLVVLCDHVRSLLDGGFPLTECVEPALHGDFVEEEVLPVIKLGLICTSQLPSNRPSMAEVVQILELVKSPSNSKDL